jgi:DNA-binding transcriptional ArsR family regulator
VRVQDLTGRELGYQVQVDARLAYEFLISLCAMGNPEEHPTYEIGQSWFDNIRTTGSQPLRSALHRVGDNVGKVWINLIGLATQPPAPQDVPSLLHLVRELEPRDLRLYLLGFHVPAYRQSVTGDVLERAADGDPQATVALLADQCYFHGEAEQHLGPLLDLTPRETKSAVLEVMERWYQEIFQPREAEWGPILHRDAAAKRLMLETMPPAEVIEAASGIQFIPQPGIRQVHLIPQLATRPWVWLAEHDDARLYCYPVADESLGPDASAPPSRLVRLHKALGDEKRLRMLKAIATSGATLQELAERFGLPKSTAHHHLAILRSAGLIRVTSDEEHRYSVRRDVLPEMAGLLDAYLGPTRTTTEERRT